MIHDPGSDISKARGCDTSTPLKKIEHERQKILIGQYNNLIHVTKLPDIMLYKKKKKKALEKKARTHLEIQYGQKLVQE